MRKSSINFKVVCAACEAMLLPKETKWHQPDMIGVWYTEDMTDYGSKIVESVRKHMLTVHDIVLDEEE